ncbi:MAG: phosphoribosylaminoimidazolesuccinocarboxamide synthase [Gammaproteobacteria bacterium]
MAMLQSDISSLPLIGRGKVRDLYAIGEDRLLMVQTDRLSAFDIVLDDAIPGKGEVLTQMTRFWLNTLPMKNHLCEDDPQSVVAETEKQQVAGRAVIAQKLNPLPVEAVCRGYLVGSGWKDYQKSGAVCGLQLPSGLRLADKLPQTIFTPATKAEQGEHDENISFGQMANIIGDQLAAKVRDAALMLYETAAKKALECGVIIADTKFEFAADDDGELILIDEALTPDSSRFWQAAKWQPGQNPESYDKQFARDWLEEQEWDKTHPAPRLPPEIIKATAARYREIQKRLTGQ